MIQFGINPVNVMSKLIIKGNSEDFIYQNRHQYTYLMDLNKEEINSLYLLSVKVDHVRKGIKMGVYALAEGDSMVRRLLRGAS